MSKSASQLHPGLKAGIIGALLHYTNEVVCFYALAHVIARSGGNEVFLWLTAFLYDALAFLPQSLIAALSDRFPKLPLGTLGALLLSVSFLPLALGSGATLAALLLLSLGNACIHVSLAELTLRASKGRLMPASLYVGAGAFGVISGRLLGLSACPCAAVLLLAAAMFFAFLFLESAVQKQPRPDMACWDGRYRSSGLPDGLVLLLAVLVVSARAYMGTLIPTEWNRSSLTTVLLFLAMGLGKILGGILADRIGCRKTAFLSIVLALPFLLLGNRLMLVSLVGILLFSMTMPITLGALVSVLPDYPGVAFGLTTAGLFLGTLPGFFLSTPTGLPGILLISALSVICLLAVLLFLPKEHS